MRIEMRTHCRKNHFRIGADHEAQLHGRHGEGRDRIHRRLRRPGLERQNFQRIPAVDLFLGR